MADREVKRIAGTVQDMAQLYGVTRKTIHVWIKQGVLKPVQMVPRGDRYFDLEAEIARFKARAAEQQAA